ncbi:pyruvate dehydrogenase E1 component alpha subunit mitochondrial precursor [Penicillium hispanicum]|uniref:pyruvate dehydrogenase E1 component alpha subunit mitochondrial precursor n=1 Tax=Penicillium hispanicum TaxID=1080232 RepID=UPI00254010F1|nr:pyruvate dehydrogenase E1 component alpha subunit mitochondrial precursor [Penicillium hispanicum]KAJ5595036.1 pyruvate dehydrogenase E1 component alpha subunit mitochondrial precursor [Penicillium hispanicum]
MSVGSRALRLQTSISRVQAGQRGFAQVAKPDDIPSEDDKPFTVPVSEKSFKTYLFDSPPYSVETTKSQLKRLYRDMTLIRRMEMAADNLYKEKKIRGFCHLSSGQEAVTVGIEHAISSEDKLITAYRSHGYTLMRGGTIRSILGELLGRRDGIAHGKGGSMHMYAKSFFGGNGIVGANVPVGTGIALAQQYEDTGNITINLYGDGAANQGQVHESFNMAKLWNLPIIFGCENNKYGMGTSVERASASTEYYKRGQYIPGLWVDGMDVLAVLGAVRHGRDYVKAGNGPLLYEYDTYRYAGHSMSDPGVAYRSREELQTERSNDPISNLRTKLMNWGVLTENETKDIDRDVRGIVNHEVEQAEQMPVPEPSLEKLFEDIYVPGSEPFQRRGRTVDETIF